MLFKCKLFFVWLCGIRWVMYSDEYIFIVVVFNGFYYKFCKDSMVFDFIVCIDLIVFVLVREVLF